VFHEYGHGLTQRMIGGMNGPMAGAVGEGASDVNAFLLNGDDTIGEYSFGNPLGIRSQAYATFVGSYLASVTGTEVHFDGELYAAIIWRVKENYLAAGLTVADVQDDWIDGFNFTPSTPAYEHMRDGMLAAAAPERQCLIWEGFAHFGVGVGARGITRGKRVIITESFALPPTCP
jgi:extracellular elastinolytic metalloproteinase